jgi:4-hydroxybenzoate polyprenyltransferase
MGIILCIILELLFFLFCSVNGFLLALTAVLYSLLMFKEFFIPQHIRPYLTTYAVSHTVVTVLLSLTMFAALSGVNITQLPSDAFKYALVTWFLFNIFEFGRKTFLLSEEREDVPSYSNIFGKHGAFFLVLSQAFLAYLLTVSMNCFVGRFIPIFMTLIMVPLIFLGVLFVVKTDGPWGKLYRHFSSVYIILFYVGVLCFLF